MSKNFGPDQDKVLETENRSWVNPIFLSNRPALSSEVNLISQISSEMGQKTLKSLVPSGFLSVGRIRETEDISALESGEIAVSESFNSNTFYLGAKQGTNLAIVNGWLIEVSGTNNLSGGNLHNLITLPEDPTHNSTFVFLEAWLERVTYTDPVKKFGNVDALSESNDLLNNSVGIETSQRVQLKYRLRAQGSSANLHITPDGFDSSVKAFGSTGTYTGLTFESQAKNGDPGLYRAGNGQQNSLDTVDGYSYAIPMFFIDRRKVGTFSLDEMYNGQPKSVGYSTRPDGLYQDVVYPSDIVDLRHTVSLGNTDVESLLSKTLKGITKGAFSTTKGRVIGFGGGLGTAPGGTTLLKHDTITSNVPSLSPKAGNISNLPRRSFCNRNNVQESTVVKIDSWLSTGVGDFDFRGTIDLSSFPEDLEFLPNSGDILKQFLYTDDSGYANTEDFDIIVNYMGAGPKVAVVFVKNTVVPTSTSTAYINIPFVIKPSTTEDLTELSGFSEPPSKLLEQWYSPNGSDTHRNAELYHEVSLYDISPTDYYPGDIIKNLGSEYQDVVNFGMVMVAKRIESSPGLIQFNYLQLPKMGQEILGVRYVRRVKSDGSYSDYKTGIGFRVDLNTGNFEIFGIPSAVSGETSKLEVCLYLGTKFNNSDREGRGVVETYESRSIAVNQVGLSSEYFITTQGLSLTSNEKTFVSYCYMLTGSEEQPITVPYVLKKESGTNIKNSLLISLGDLPATRAKLPVTTINSTNPDNDVRPTYIRWDNLSIINNPGDELTIPVHLLSYLENTEEVNYIYQTRGYQGVTPVSPEEVEVIKEGPAIITSKGSGATKDSVFRVDEVEQLGNGSFRALGSYTRGQVSKGDLFFLKEGGVPHRISKVSEILEGGNTYTVFTTYERNLPVSFPEDQSPFFIRKGINEFLSEDIIGRLPTKLEDSYRFSSENLSLNYQESEGVAAEILDLPVLFTKPIASSTDLEVSEISGVDIGSGSPSTRGRYSSIIKSIDGYDMGVTNPNPSNIYPKVGNARYKIFQSYLVKKKSDGRLYMAVISSESKGSLFPRLSVYNGDDVFDLFELKGRVLTRV